MKPSAFALVAWAAFLITVMQVYALSQGVNGALFSVSVATVAALAAGAAGFRIGRR